MTWLTIEYRDFYDFPRVFLVEREDAFYLFDCPFNDLAEDYLDHFDVHRLSKEAVEALGKSWKDLTNDTSPIGRISTADVEFATTKQCCIDERVFNRLS